MGSKFYKLTKPSFIDGALRDVGDTVEIEDEVFQAPKEDVLASRKNANIAAVGSVEARNVVVPPPLVPFQPHTPGQAQPPALDPAADPSAALAALDQPIDQTGGLGAIKPEERAPLDFNILAKADIKGLLDGAGITYDPSLNKAGLVAIAEDNRELTDPAPKAAPAAEE